MTPFGERLFAALLRAYPRDFRERYAEDLLAFFREDSRHPRYGDGALRPVRFWLATLRDLGRTAIAERLPMLQRIPRPDKGTPMRTLAALRFDLHNALRSLRGTPAVTLTALLVLTLGIGASTAIFSVVDGIVLRGLPFADEGRLVAIVETEPATGRALPAAYANFADWSQRQDVFASIGASASSPLLTTADAERAERLRPLRVTPSLFDVLQVRPALGAAFTDTDVRNNPRLALISDGIWRRRFGADPGVVGRTMTFDTGAYQIAGVMPPGFVYPIGSAVVSNIDMWIPYVPQPKESTRGGARNYSLRVVGRLKPGTSIEQASARMQQIRDVLATETPSWFADRGIAVRRMKELIVPPAVRSWMLMLLAAVAGVLLVACANVANLLLARASGRSREIAVRGAMGASRWQLIRGLIVESVALALAGTGGGLLLAIWGVDVLRATLPPSLPRVSFVAVDLRVVAVAGLAAVATGVLCGLLPALQMSKVDVSSALRSARASTASRGRQRIRTVFLVTEVALAATLLVGAGVFMASFVRLVRTDLGFDPDRVLMVNVVPRVPAGAAGQPPASLSDAALRRALDTIRSLPGIESAAIVAGGAPLSGSWSTRSVKVPGRSAPTEEELVVKQATSAYFETIGATMLSGRTIAPPDHPGAPLVVVINDEAARRYFGHADPLGAQMTIENDSPRTIVGVVRGMRLLGPETEVKPEAYVPYEQATDISVSPAFVIRTAQDPADQFLAIKNAIWGAVPRAVIQDPQTFEELYAGMIAQRKLNMILLGLFGGLALLIASIGIYGVFAYLVEQRTKEIGVRIALGAVPGRIVAMVLSRATMAIAMGLGVGFVAAAWLERLVMAFVYGGVPHDPIVYGATAGLLLALGCLAAYVPARRAARVDPLIALRAE